MSLQAIEDDQASGVVNGASIFPFILSFYFLIWRSNIIFENDGGKKERDRTSHW